MFRNSHPFAGTMRDLLEIKGLFLFLLLCIITFLLLFIKKTFIEFEITAFQILDERGQLGLFKLISALQYLSIPVVYLLKFTFISFFVWVGCFGFGYRVPYRDCWHIVLASEFVFVFPEMIKIMWFLLVETDPNYAEVRAFYPLSMMQLFSHELIADKWHYPLKSLNFFEVIYWFFLVAGIYIKSQKQYRQSIVIGLFGYVIPYLIWLGYYTIVYK